MIRVPPDDAYKIGESVIEQCNRVADMEQFTGTPMAAVVYLHVDGHGSWEITVKRRQHKPVAVNE